MLFRGARVLARASAEGDLMVDQGRVDIRYPGSNPKVYRAALSNLDPIAGAKIVADEPVPPQVAVTARKPGGGARTGSRGSRASMGAPDSHQPGPPISATIAYADGACSGNPGPAGAGAVLIDPTGEYEHAEYLGVGTNNIAELTAILRAAERADRALPLAVYTDSSYAIGVLTKGWRAKANVELIASVKAALATLDHVSLHYVPGHAGVPLNERADGLARLAVATRETVSWRKVL
jgi:ribonuclease HI